MKPEPPSSPSNDPIPGTSNARRVPRPGLKLVTDKSAWPDLGKYVKDVVGMFME